MNNHPIEFGEFPEGKTNYQILNELGEKTTITLEKWVADILQVELNDVHSRIQVLYNKINEQHPNVGRKIKGNMIREAAVRKANEYQETKKKILGWNDDELFMAL